VSPLRHVKRILWLLLLALPASAAAGPHDGTVTQKVTSGQVTAEFSYAQSGEAYRDVRLKLIRAGRTLVDADLLRAGCPDCAAWRPTGRLVLRSLDADAEPELLLDFFSGGAYCCTYSLVYRYDPAAGSYARQQLPWGTSGYRLVDLDGTGSPEFLSADHRFDSAFGPHAVSVEPIRIWRYEAGRLVDVTRRFPGRIKADAAQHWRLYLKVRRSEHREVRGILPAWLADQALLGRQAHGWRTLEAAYARGELGRGRVKDGYPAGRRYLAKLRSFLRSTGYTR
jgi:hypothetical protein